MPAVVHVKLGSIGLILSAPGAGMGKSSAMPPVGQNVRPSRAIR